MLGTHLIASIPSPPWNTFELGPLNIRLYGLSIAIGVIVAVVVSSKRWEARGGDPDDIGTLALWCVPAGVIGARMYHVATDYRMYEGRWIDAFKITQGGLGIPGGIALGVITGLVVVKVKKLPAVELLDVVAPALPLAQAIGRLGNWFNQEVFGRPTTLPWGLEIDPAFRPPRYLNAETFHPTFLYEGLWNLGLALLLIWLDHHRRLRKGELFTLYVLGYSVGRLWVEGLRSDHASLIFGVRVNTWMSLVGILVTSAVLIHLHRRPRPDRPRGLGPNPDVVLVAPGGGEVAVEGDAAASSPSASGSTGSEPDDPVSEVLEPDEPEPDEPEPDEPEPDEPERAAGDPDPDPGDPLDPS